MKNFWCSDYNSFYNIQLHFKRKTEIPMYIDMGPLLQAFYAQITGLAVPDEVGRT